ncbi:uncharacterized protein LOC129233747 [Uloborus diversus]|uniref:uncharacterized protein LOC129233747 n=1 Tax=Uloborus diversus TaxID=327109 RepID=UPI00240927F3|nr:uncharacterized protein LOC129233747 [Uloborus diversus]
MKDAHKEDQQFRDSKRCVCCNAFVPSKDILSHYDNVHDISVTTIELNFLNLDDFMKWKDDEEKKTRTSYVKARASKDLKSSTYSSFYCHRSGHFKSHSSGERCIKLLGSNKIDGHCPAKISLNQSKTTGQCVVKFTCTHIGHTNDIGRLKLSAVDKEFLSAKISAKVPFDTILDEIRDSVSPEGFQRLHLLTNKDLHNIKKSFGLFNDVVRHENDAVSVEYWLEHSRDEKNCTIYYKPQGTLCDDEPLLKPDDFILVIMNNVQKEMLRKFSGDCICVDSTHGTNPYGFQLSTVMVIDEMRQGFPRTFLISSKVDTTVLSIF